jgi:dTDP-4-amino-4,6-dideoxygalactose transaminase
MADVIALGEPSLGDRELKAVAEVFRSGWVAGQGPTTRRFEAALAKATATAHAVATNNCTAALHLALMALGIGPGDEVIVGDYTFPATGHAVAYTGARPVFADVRPDTWCVDPRSIESRISARTKGIVAVDVAGQPADYAELAEVADRHGLFLVEDAACSAGATYRGRPAGGLADVGCFSFHGRKGITCGEGGALVTDDERVAAFVEKAHNFGIESALNRSTTVGLSIPSFTDLGYNYKLSDISAAIMLVQLERLDELVGRRQAVADGYQQLLGDLDLIQLPVVPADRTHAWQAYIVTVDSAVDRDAVVAAMRADGVQCNFGTYASHQQPVYGDTDPCPVSADVFARHIAIPMHANLSRADVERVAETLVHAVKNAA